MTNQSRREPLPLEAQSSSLPNPLNFLLVRTMETNRCWTSFRLPFSLSFLSFLSFLSIFSLSFLFLPPSNFFWSRCRTPFLIHLDTWQSPGNVFHMPLISPTHFMHDDTWLSMCQVFARLVPHGMCPPAMCCRVIRPFYLETLEIPNVPEFDVIRPCN